MLRVLCNGSRFSFLTFLIVLISFILFWNVIDWQLVDYDEDQYATDERAARPFQSELDATTPSGNALEDPDGGISGNGSLVPDDVWHTYADGDPLAMNYLLWSRKPHKVDWAKPEAMCKTLLDPSAVLTNETVDKARNWTIPYKHSDASMLSLLSDCDLFRRVVRFPSEPASNEEAEYPLAYVVVAARNVAQTIRMFRAIYQPQNAYCITYDNKTSEVLKRAIRQLATCFEGENVFLTPSPENIYYTHYTILHSVMVCMEVLLKQSQRIPWRYVQAVSWNDYPLRTNYEMVRIFKIFNGSQDCALDRNIEGFYVFYHDTQGDVLPHLHKPVTPDGLTMYKGSYATSMTKEFVEFLFANPTSRKFYKWLNGTKCPEEHYWPTLIHNLHLNAPGQFPGECQHFYEMRGRKKPFVSRYQIWTFSREKCKGKMTNWSCVYGIRDLPILIQRPELIAHKIYEEFESAATFCLDYWYWRRVKYRLRLLNETYYEKFPSVRYHRLKDKDNFLC